MKMKGRSFKFGDDINTDYIIAGKYRSKGLDMKLLARHTMEDLDPDFSDKVQPGDFIVAGKNFGCGSSREYATKVIIETGISAILAKSFARIFYRNCINSGLVVLECDTDNIFQGDQLEIDLSEGIIINLTHKDTKKFKPIPSFMNRILVEGGLVNYFKKYNDLY